jgi:O-antigen ligase
MPATPAVRPQGRASPSDLSALNGDALAPRSLYRRIRSATDCDCPTDRRPLLARLRCGGSGAAALEEAGMPAAWSTIVRGPHRVFRAKILAMLRADMMPAVDNSTGVRRFLSRAGDWLVAAILFTLPWSTGATSALIVCWVVVALLTLDFSKVLPSLSTPAVILPILLVMLAALGILWAEVPWFERLEGFEPFLKLLAIPLLMIHFSRSDAGLLMVSAYLISAVLLLGYSWASFWWPSLAWIQHTRGVPVKDSIYQSIFFMIAICILLHLGITWARERKHGLALLCMGLIGAFITNIAYVANSRTALVILPILLLMIAYQQFGRYGMLLMLIGMGVVGATTWTTSSYLRERVTTSLTGTLEPSSRLATPESLRIAYWRASLDGMKQAPILGLRTGSIRQLLDEALLEGRTPPSGFGIRNPHNQILAVGIQLGILGILVLLAMWLSHLLLFMGNSWPARLGSLIVLQNIIASLFNSHLSDFTAGWLYVCGVGIAGGMVLGQIAKVDCSDPSRSKLLAGRSGATSDTVPAPQGDGM